MSALTPESLRSSLNNLIDKLTFDKHNYTRTPHDHTRTRKLSFKTVITSILQMSGGSINHELLTLAVPKTRQPLQLLYNKGQRFYQKHSKHCFILFLK